ncbi:MAG TPA: polyprenyl synthetase family protein [Acidimicrobiales bacterium]|nr:polyprenyl synthetase family protein [Acidimicrobiales bacterium]
MIPTASVPEVLARARGLVGPALRRAVATLSPELRPLAEYHLGWRDASGDAVESDGGKGIRPALAVLSAEAVGAPGEVGVPGAVAVELVHNFSLIHDDVIDEDAERRHRPTVWALFGVGQAVIVGDALIALAQQVVLGPDAAAGAGRAARCLADATAAMIAGQALDMAFETVPAIDVAGCLAMEAGKTGALLGCAASLGAILAGAPAETVSALDRYGVELGLAFQAVDDLLGIWGDPAVTGKPAWSDLRQRKKTLPVVAALAAGGARAEELAALLASEHLEEAQVARAAQLVEACGGRSAATAEARRRLDAALGALGEVALVERTRAELTELARFVVEREF